MKKEYRVRKHQEFDRIIHAGKKLKTPHFILYAEPSPEAEHVRIGLAISKSNGGAVQRVREKRQVRAMLARRNDYADRLNLIILIRPSFDPEAKKANEEELNQALDAIKGNLN